MNKHNQNIFKFSLVINYIKLFSFEIYVNSIIHSYYILRQTFFLFLNIV